jgi:hypothetical protein
VASSPLGETSKRAFDYDRLTTFAELQELKKALVESPPLDPIMPEAKTSKMSIQPEETLIKTILLSTMEPSKVALEGNSLVCPQKNYSGIWSLIVVLTLTQRRC